MTDETRTHDAQDAQGRTPSDFTDDAGQSPPASRPHFLPAGEASPSPGEQPGNDGWSQLGEPPGQGRWSQAGQPDDIGRPGEGGWGDPSGRVRQDTAVFGPPVGPPPPPSQAFGMGAGWAPPPGGFPGAAVSPRPAPRTSTMVILAVLVALLASTLGSVGTYLLTRPDVSGRDPSFTLGKAPSGSNSRPPDSIAGVAAKVLPSVVSLAVDGGTSAATGSGFLIKGGYVVTNNHVVAAAAPGGEIQIQFSNRKSTSARIIGRDPESDLAVVKPDETFGAPEISLGNSDNVVVGDPVVAIGSPLGLVGTVTSGIVSSLNRPVQAGEENSSDTTWLSAIQTDAAINPGNSGGPLVNASGEVIGVNSAIATLGRSAGGQSGSIGLGFAIPVNHARRIAEELVANGVAKKSRIGVTLDQTYRGTGVRIDSEAKGGTRPVEPDGPADKAGLKPGDVILEIDGTVVQDSTELIALIRNKAPGEKLTVKFQRGGQEKTATVIVGAAAVRPTPQPS
ncbi:putative serine protease PepD [Streptosporangium album]|uniref:Putative serine protease PepD n=1 Tax=Streptosporangium album TaxID=47479 RepID=A0A7W7W8X0_9ACTN|nr:trypsin-like peptidase domain-containing protein [Streptosporangium album]MBB4937440.1 putative serine protease PepD [Streptosporangium album]